MLHRFARSYFRPPPARVAALTLLAAATLAAGLFGCGESAIEPGLSGQSGTLIRTVEGPVQGKLAGATRAFLGIPYVAPPIGDLRWKPPQPIEHWSAPRDATEFGPGCPQGAVILPPGLAPEFPQDESCLYLNVWTPEPQPQKPTPVMVWIPGGGFFGGTSQGVEFSASLDDVPYYDAQSLVERTGAVVVSMNYRVGVLGFLAHPALSAEDTENGVSGNYGIEDQRAALEWVQRNIAAFSGDPNNVTIFGESSGGASVCLQVVSPLSRGLFHRAIAESGACRIAQALPQAEEAGVALATRYGCTDPATVLSCLRAKNAQDFIADSGTSGGGLRWRPVTDGLNFPKSPVELLRDGNIARVPMIIGTNNDEGTLFTAAAASSVRTAADYDAYIRRQYGDQADAVLALYPAADYAVLSRALADITTDQRYVCPAREMARATSSAGVPIYLYTFVYDDWALGYALGAFHGSEIRFIFGTPLLGTPVSPAEQPLLETMTGYWARLATTGDPNGGDAPPWPAYTSSDEQHIVLDLAAISTGAHLKQAKCDFWDALAAATAAP
jgi:para-nitrobenzyl esterase